MIDWLEKIDIEFFFQLNGLHQPWLDQPMHYMTKAIFWLPVYFLIAYMIIKTYDWKVFLWSLLGIVVIVTLCDRISVELFKEVFKRYRPSRNVEYGHLVHIVNDYRGGLYSFVSSHATNFFGISSFVFLLVRKNFKKAAPWLIVWAGLISYTRVYLGVHYPSDILVGSLLGAFIGYFTYLLFKRFLLRRE